MFALLKSEFQYFRISKILKKLLDLPFIQISYSRIMRLRSVFSFKIVTRFWALECFVIHICGYDCNKRIKKKYFDLTLNYWYNSDFSPKGVYLVSCLQPSNINTGDGLFLCHSSTGFIHLSTRFFFLRIQKIHIQTTSQITQ